MNLKTTLALLVLVVAGGVLFTLGPTLPPGLGLGQPVAPTGAGTSAVLASEITADKLKRVEIDGPAGKVVLERGPGGDWSLPGKWPTRQPEVEALVKELGALAPRFAPVPVEEASDLQVYGLKPPSVTAIVTADDKRYRLQFGTEPGDNNRVARPTYLRIADTMNDAWQDKPEVVRLRPGLAADLGRPAEFYQQRRLFPSERVAKADDAKEKVDQLTATGVTAKDGMETMTLAKDADGWRLTEPVTDRADPEALQKLLRAVPDLWAERFVDAPKGGLKEVGLEKPERTLTVVRPGGEAMTLEIGSAVPRAKKDAPPEIPFPGMPPRPKPETFRYAKLQDNGQIFTVKDAPLKDIFVSLGSLRDPKLASFKPDDAVRLEMTQGDKEIVLVKKEGRWHLEKPLATDADGAKVTELLTGLAKLEAKGDDVIDKGDAKEYGLETPPATLTLSLEEPIKDKKETKARTIKYLFGAKAKDGGKVYVRVDGWPRVNAIGKDVAALAERPALAYRGRGILNFEAGDLAQIEVERGKDKVVLNQTDGQWKLTQPVEAGVDPAKARTLALALGRLGAIEYVNDAPTPEDLDKQFGLAKPDLSVTLTFTGEGKPRTLLVGKQKGDKTEYYAKMADAPAVFTIPKVIHDDIDRDALAYRPLQLWHMSPDDLTAVRVAQPGQAAYALEREVGKWKVTGPFEAPVSARQADTMANALATLKVERYETHAAKDLAPFGLDKPFLRLTVVEKAEEGKPAKEQTLLVGKPTAKGAETRYAKLADGDAIVVVGPAVARAFDGGPLDFLDRNLLTISGNTVRRLKSVGGDGTMTVERDKDGAWRVEANGVKFAPDKAALASMLSVWSNLQAQRYAAYGPKVDLPMYGLDKPAATVTITAQSSDDAKPTEHTLALGKSVDGGEHYARLDDGMGVIVLSKYQAEGLTKSYLDLVDRALLKFDAAAVTGLSRKMADQEMELAKRDDGWHIVKPAEQRGDDKAIDKLLEQLSRLQATRIAAYPAKGLKKFGLADPTATLTIRLGEDKGKERILNIGSEVPAAEREPGQYTERYFHVEGSDAVGVMAGDLARQLLAAPVGFRDRAVAKFADADKAILERGARKATFTRVDGTWKLTEPIEADAEQGDLQDFVDDLAHLRGDELVTDKAADLKTYGLDKPQARWRFLSGDKEVLALLVGGLEKGKGRAYAKTAGGDLIFLLSPTQTTRALGEYRNRTLWPALDPNVIERVEFKTGKTSFALEQTDGKTWHVVGKPEVKVNTATLNDTLAALGGLKAERTVVDANPDLKLFGLDAPTLIIDVKLREGGTRVLQIGRSEGESKRSYARVADGKRGDVFIISEADGARLIRKLADLTKKE